MGRTIQRVKKKMEKYVKINDLKNIEKLLQEYGWECFSDVEVEDNNILQHTIYENNIDMLKVLIENGWDINQVDDYKENVLFDAIYFHGNQNQDIKTYLIEKGINIHQKTYDGDTILMNAINGGDYETGDLLVSLGVSLVTEDDYGDNVFDWLGEKDTEDIEKWMKVFTKNQEHMDEESLKLLKVKRLENLF